MRWRLLVGVVVAGGCGLVAGGALAARVSLCVPGIAGQTVKSGACAGSNSGKTVRLPANSAEQQTLISILPHIKFVSTGVGGKPTIRFSGVNVQVVSGSGSTSGTVNGKGNLIVGYAENPANHAQTGSNDLIVGTGNSWSKWGEIVGGTNNTATGPYGAVFGAGNTTSGTGALAAGHANVAKGTESSVVGGQSNTAAGSEASVAGGADNAAKDSFSSVAGGCGNLILATASAAPEFTLCDSASGGEMESIAGGENNLATGAIATITGGSINLASGPQASVTGGSANTASGAASAISGGVLNTASGNQAAISGGNSNIASGGSSSVSGGKDNDTTDAFGSILGGCSNTTGGSTNPNSFVCIAGDGPANTVSGGSDNTSKGQLDSMLGGFDELIQASAADSQVGTSFFGP